MSAGATLLHPAMRAGLELVQQFAPRGTLTSTFRSVDEQRKLYQDFIAGRSMFPADPPGHSTHHTGLSFDYVVREGSSSVQQRGLGEFWRSIGGIWGPADPIHFQHPEARDAVRLGLVHPYWWL